MALTMVPVTTPTTPATTPHHPTIVTDRHHHPGWSAVTTQSNRSDLRKLRYGPRSQTILCAFN
jgi:hypothetical protein